MINPVLGLMNSGKTLYMTHQLLKAWNKGKTIITNYALYFPKNKLGNKIYKINKDTLTAWALKGTPLKNVAIGLDEFWLWCDSRLSIANTTTTYFFNQSSKDDQEIYMTSQHNGQLDSRLRENCHKLTQCSRALFHNGKMIDIDEEQRFLPKEMLPKLYIKVIEFKRVNRGFVTDIEVANMFYIRAMKYFNLYDTTQKITKQ